MTLISRRGLMGWGMAATTLPGFTYARSLQALDTPLAELALSDGSVLRYSLSEVMAAARIPAVSFAVISDFRIVAASAYGATGAGETMAVTTCSLFQAASVSKPVTATWALTLVARGKLSLDRNVNDHLTHWRVPDNAFTATQKVRLRRILSHTAGFNVHGFPGYAIDAQRPGIRQILDGVAPTNTEPVRVVFEPGSRQEYSGGGISVEQLMMSDVTGKAFAQLMQDAVLGPLAMRDSGFGPAHFHWQGTTSGSRHSCRWHDGSRAVPHLSRTGGGQTVDDAVRPGAVRHRHGQVTAGARQPHPVCNPDGSDVHQGAQWRMAGLFQRCAQSGCLHAQWRQCRFPVAAGHGQRER